MGLREDDFHELKSRVDKVASELDKQNALNAVNKKWMITVGALILAALGYTSFIQIPKEAIKAVQQQVGEDTIKEAKEIIENLKKSSAQAEEILNEVGEFKLKSEKNSYFELEMDKVDKVLFLDPECKVGVIRSAKNDYGRKGEQLAICACQDTKKGRGWVCFN